MNVNLTAVFLKVQSLSVVRYSLIISYSSGKKDEFVTLDSWQSGKVSAPSVSSFMSKSPFIQISNYLKKNKKKHGLFSRSGFLISWFDSGQQPAFPDRRVMESYKIYVNIRACSQLNFKNCECASPGRHKECRLNFSSEIRIIASKPAVALSRAMHFN